MATYKTTIEIFKEEQRRFLFTKLQILHIFLVALLLITVVRLWYLQIIKGDYFSKLSKYNVIKKVRLEPIRGRIFDRNLNLLVSNKPKFDVYFVPKDTETPTATLKTLSGICNVDYNELNKSYREGYFSPFHPIKLIENVGKYDLARIMEGNLEIPGVYVEFRHKRFYPYKNLASQLLGYVGEISKRELNMEKFKSFRAGDIIGTSGLEKKFDDYLHGTPGSKYVKYDAKGQNLGDMRIIKKAVLGMNLVLTLDVEVQDTAEKLLKDRAGAIVVMDPRNGDILAIASGPGFDPNLFSTKISSEKWNSLQNDPMKPLQHRAIQGQYPPGSIFKIISGITILKNNSFNPDEVTFYCGGKSYLQDKFKCWQEYGHGKMNLHTALVNSCNTYFYNLEKYIGVEDLIRTSSEWMLGKVTDINFPGEKPGFIPSPEWQKRVRSERWYRGDTISMLIGQGSLLVTPIQMSTFIASIANGGILYRPRLIKNIVDWEGDVDFEFPVIVRKKLEISDMDIDILKDALWGVVNKDGTGWRARVRGYDICGKTGTAQVVSADQVEEYEENEQEIPYELRAHAWFVGFAPKDDPEIAISVLVEHGGGGGRTAAPIAREIFKSYFESRENQENPEIVSIQF